MLVDSMENRPEGRSLEQWKYEEACPEKIVCHHSFFVLGLIPMLLVLRKVKAGYQLGDLRLEIKLPSYHGWHRVVHPEQKADWVVAIQIFSQDISMELEISNCVTLIMKGGAVWILADIESLRV